MSRQHGKKRPAPSAHAQQRARPERPARPRWKLRPEPARPAEAQARSGPAPEAPEQALRRRKWFAVAVSTLMLYVSYISVLIAFVAASESDERQVGAAEITVPLTLGLALVPFVFGAAAYTSRHPRFVNGVLKALGLFLLAIPTTALLQDPVTGMVVGFGAGGIVALRVEPALGYRPRVYAVLATAVYTAVLVRAFPGIGLLAVAALPMAAVAIGDVFAEKRAQRLAAAGRA